MADTFRTARLVGLSHGTGPDRRVGSDGLCTHCGVPMNAPGHSGHYLDNTEVVRDQASGASGPPGKTPFTLGGAA